MAHWEFELTHSLSCSLWEATCSRAFWAFFGHFGQFRTFRALDDSAGRFFGIFGGVFLLQGSGFGI